MGRHQSGVPRLKTARYLVSTAAFIAVLLPLRAQEPQTAPPERRPGQQGATSPPQTARPGPAQRRDIGQAFFGLTAKPDPEAVDRGQKLFVATCGFCHGTNALGGNAGPNLVRSVLVLHDEGTGKEIGPVILNGRPDKGMPKFALSEPQIKDIAAFLLSRTQAAVVRMDYKTLNIVTGNAEQGKQYFEAHCSSCHSPTGDLAHVASKYEPEALQSRLLYPEVRRRPGSNTPSDPRTQATAKVTNRNGQTVEGTLAYLDDFTVVVTDKNGEPHSWFREEPGLQVEVQDPLKGHADLLPQYTDADMHNLLAYLVTLK